MKKLNLLVLLFIAFCLNVCAQSIEGKVEANQSPVPFANIILDDNNKGVAANNDGVFVIENVKKGSHYIVVSAIGMVRKKVHIDIVEGVNTINIELKSSAYNLNQVVVTGTKTFKRRTESPVIVNVIDNKQLQRVQACNLSEGLNFQPGIRVETDCQTCITLS